MSDAPITLTIKRRGTTVETVYQPGTVILTAAFDAKGINPPYSCLAGACATCLARVTEGSTVMEANSVLSEEEVAQGYILTCQAIPTSPHVTVEYEE